jgi:hypothetical protein
MKRSAAMLYVCLVLSTGMLKGQLYIPADPINILFFEASQFELGTQGLGDLLLRPSFSQSYNNWRGHWQFQFRTEIFWNDNAPNLENTSDRWIGKGMSFFESFKLSFMNKVLAFTIEPFSFYNSNKNYDEPYRIDDYSKLNDNRAHVESPYRVSGIREAQIYLHYRGIGFGYSNANMWWGPGIHTSLNMTSNTTGFPYMFIGTTNEQHIRDIGIQVKYVFSDLKDKNVAEPYYTALAAAITYYSSPQITFGFSRTYLTGGNRTDETISKWEAMTIPFEAFFLKNKVKDGSPESSLDIWDQTLVGYLQLTFPEVNFKVFIEYGRNDHAWDGKDFSRQPDHTAASIIGFRKYGFFGHDNIIGGFEYANLIKTKFWPERHFEDWYARWEYDYSNYDGRHWAAHSGPDSDDFYVFLGYLSDTFSFFPSFNYERHGVIDNSLPELPVKRFDGSTTISNNPYIWPEVKFEYRFDFRYNWKNFKFNLYYEREKIANLEFREKKRKTNIIWLGVEYYFDKKFWSRMNDLLKKSSLDR